MCFVNHKEGLAAGRVIARDGNDVRLHVPASAALDPCPRCAAVVAEPASPTRLRASRGGGVRWTFLTRECPTHDIAELTAAGPDSSVALRVDGPPWEDLFSEVHTEIGALERRADEVPSWLARALPRLLALTPSDDPQEDEDAVWWALLDVPLARGRELAEAGLHSHQIWHLRAALATVHAERMPMHPALRQPLEESLRSGGGRARPRSAEADWLPLDVEVAWVREMQDDPGLDEHMAAGWIRAGVLSPADRPAGLDPRDAMVLTLAEVPPEARWAGSAQRLCPSVLRVAAHLGREPEEALALATTASGFSLNLCEHLTLQQEYWTCGWTREDSVAVADLMIAAADVNWEDLAVCLRAQMGRDASLHYLRSGGEMDPVRLLAGPVE